MAKRTVLIVEDEVLIALDLQQSIEEMGYEALTAVTIAEAVSALDTRHIEFVVLDYRLGPNDTSSLAERLTTNGIPFVVCSGTDIDSTRSVFRDAEFLSKPAAVNELKSAIEAALR